MSLSSPQQIEQGPTAQGALAELDKIARELDQRSKQLHKVEADLEPIEIEYEAFMADFEIGLWQKHEDEGAKLPPEKLRVRLGHKAIDPVLYGRYVGLINSRKRLEKRISSLGKQADAQRSVLSALKVEMEATS